MAQNDHVHFYGAGYHMLGDAVVRDLMSQYDLFVKARGDAVAVGSAAPGVVAKVSSQPAAEPTAQQAVSPGEP